MNAHVQDKGLLSAKESLWLPYTHSKVERKTVNVCGNAFTCNNYFRKYENI